MRGSGVQGVHGAEQWVHAVQNQAKMSAIRMAVTLGGGEGLRPHGIWSLF